MDPKLTRQDVARARYAQTLREVTARYAPKPATLATPERRRRLPRLFDRAAPA